MKRIISMLVLCTVLLLSSCAPDFGGFEHIGEETTDRLLEFDPADFMTEAVEEKKTAKAKLGLICIGDEYCDYDLAFMLAVKAVCEEKRIGYEIKTNVPDSSGFTEAADELIGKECGIIIADSPEYEEDVVRAAQENENVEFCLCGGTLAHTEGLDNYHDVYPRAYEGTYLTGIAAGMKLKERIGSGSISEAKLGYVASFNNAQNVSAYTAFYLGARSVCPEAVMDVVFTGDRSSEMLEAQAAKYLIGEGCAVMSQSVYTRGVPTACEKAGVPDVPCGSFAVTDRPNTGIVSSRTDWTGYIAYVVDCVKNGERIDADRAGGLADGTVILTEINALAASSGTEEAIEKARTAIESGTLRVFDVRCFTAIGDANAQTDEAGHITSYKADVDRDQANKRETETVSEGYFRESEYRSAPYFDVKVDGITILPPAA